MGWKQVVNFKPKSKILGLKSNHTIQTLQCIKIFATVTFVNNEWILNPEGVMHFVEKSNS